jgi:predicted DNA-binding transcriptional regulator AlpA
VTAAQRIRRAIHEAGGVATQADLARRWQISRQHVCELVKDPTFPAPILRLNGTQTAVYAVADCDAWRANRQQRNTRRGKTK